MAETLLTPKTPVGPYPTLPIAANSADAAPASVDAVDGGAWIAVDGDILLIQNTDAGAQTATVESQADQFNRKGDITAYSLAAGEFAVFRFNRAGWADVDSKIHVTASDPAVKFLVIRAG